MIPAHCPNCNSTQAFARQRERWTVDGKKNIREFISCKMCHWQVVLYEGSEEEFKIRKDIDKLQSAVIRGVPAQRRLDDRQKRLVEVVLRRDHGERLKSEADAIVEHSAGERYKIDSILEMK